MAKITCPECKAVNQDVDISDPCWKCGIPLAIYHETQQALDAPPTFEDAEVPVSAPAQDPPLPKGPMSQLTKPPQAPLNRTLLVVIGVVVLAIILLVLFLLKGH